MDSLKPEIRAVDPGDPGLAALLDRHLTLMRASSPACSVHAMDADALVEAGVRFFAAIECGGPVAMGALKVITPEHGELKSMHVIEGMRGKGLADAILQRLLDEARGAGMVRVSLETGSQPVFETARRFYLRHGFSECPPFAGYVEDPHSIFMTREL